MTIIRVSFALLAFALFAPLRLLGETTAAFTSPPRVSAEGEGFHIEFTAAAGTDCAIAILNRDGTIVRHLAAGLLGDRAPAPLKAGSLVQTIAWDGKDDFGVAATGAPFRVRVSLGLKPLANGTLADLPAALGSVRALAVGPVGELFVFHVSGELHPSDGTPACAVFGRDGAYRRTILPFPADLPDERWAGLKRLTREDGERVPFLYQAETRSYLPGAGDLPAHRAVATRDGRVAFVGIQEGPKRYAQAGINQVLTIRSDGGVPASGLQGPRLSEISSSGASLALSPDEKTVYAAGLREGASGGGKAVPAVFRFGWKDEAASLFAGSLTEAGDAPDRFDSPRSVAVDGEGRVYVADRGNNRVAVFSPDGKPLGALAVETPERVEVHPATGALYVLAGEEMNRLIKFAKWGAAEPVAEMALPFFRHPYYTAILALDAAAPQPIVWVASPKGKYAKFDLLRIEDRGKSFGEAVEMAARHTHDTPHAGPILDLELDRGRDRLYVNHLLLDLGTGKWSPGLREAGGKSIDSQGVGSMGLDGNFYTQIYPNLIRRIGPDQKPIPFTSGEVNAKGDLTGPLSGGTMRVRGRGITADRNGDLYVLWEDGQNFTRGQAYNQLYRHHPDGSVRTERLIESRIRAVDSVRLDPAGNLYVAMGVRPGADLLPPGLRGQVPDGPKDPDAVGGLNAYPLIYGSIAKFSPKGGRIMPEAESGVEGNFAFGSPMRIEGAEWIFSGASPVVSWRTPGTPDICNCESPRFDVDEYGRSFFPDAARCRVGILDTAGNLLGWIGRYGNADAQPKDGESAEGIPLLWPYCVAAGDQGIFVGDRTNKRVLRVKLAYEAVETVDLGARK